MLSLVLLASAFALGCETAEQHHKYMMEHDTNMYGKKAIKEREESGKYKTVFTRHTDTYVIGTAQILNIEKRDEGQHHTLHWPYHNAVVTMSDGTPYHVDEDMEYFQRLATQSLITVHVSWDTQEQVLK